MSISCLLTCSFHTRLTWPAYQRRGADNDAVWLRRRLARRTTGAIIVGPDDGEARWGYEHRQTSDRLQEQRRKPQTRRLRDHQHRDLLWRRLKGKQTTAGTTERSLTYALGPWGAQGRQPSEATGCRKAKGLHPSQSTLRLRCQCVKHCLPLSNRH